MKIELTDEAKTRAIASIRRYFAAEMEEEIGDLKAALLLDFILKEIGPSVYNGAISDAQTYLRDRVADLEAVCVAEEFGFWQDAPGRRSRKPER